MVQRGDLVATADGRRLVIPPRTTASPAAHRAHSAGHPHRGMMVKRKVALLAVGLCITCCEPPEPAPKHAEPNPPRDQDPYDYLGRCATSDSAACEALCLQASRSNRQATFCVFVGREYERGRNGREQDTDRARDFYSRACRLGDETGCIEVKRLGP